MAEEYITGTASPAPPPTWWDLHSWTTSNASSSPWHQQNSSSEDDGLSISTSFTNASNHSATTVDSGAWLQVKPASMDFMGEHDSSSHLWGHLLQNCMGNNGDLASGEGFEPAACDYLTKIDSNNWEYNNLERNSDRLKEYQRLLHDTKPFNMNISFSSSKDEISQQQMGMSRGFMSSYGAEEDHNEKLMKELENKLYGITDCSPCTTSMTSRPLIDLCAYEQVPFFKPLISLSSDRRKQAASPTRIPGRTVQGITNEGKKKKSEETTETVVKKPKHESSSVSSIKGPKVKLGEKITALQQIVSPFGKTDTASVLLEAIGYIKFLQEQINLLSNPYMKTNPHKDLWGSLDRRDKGDLKFDLKSRGLCLVPVSCTQQIYQDNTGSDYWTSTYRGCLYR